jgi:hypothetical protein
MRWVQEAYKALEAQEEPRWEYQHRLQSDVPNQLLMKHVSQSKPEGKQVGAAISVQQIPKNRESRQGSARQPMQRRSDRSSLLMSFAIVSLSMNISLQPVRLMKAVRKEEQGAKKSLFEWSELLCIHTSAMILAKTRL